MAETVFGRSCDNEVPEREAGRALVPLTIPLRDAGAQNLIRPDARFVAQLIATASHLPQTRSVRRASPQHATMTYADRRTRIDLPMSANGLTLTRVA